MDIQVLRLTIKSESGDTYSECEFALDPNMLSSTGTRLSDVAGVDDDGDRVTLQSLLYDAAIWANEN